MAECDSVGLSVKLSTRLPGTTFNHIDVGDGGAPAPGSTVRMGGSKITSGTSNTYAFDTIVVLAVSGSLAAMLLN